MWVKYLRVENFRRVEKAELIFAPGINVICGGNAQGKTTLLRALKVLVGKESRFSDDCVRFGRNFFFLKGKFVRDDGGSTEVIASYSGQRANRAVDGKERNSNEVRKTFPLISLDVSSTNLVKGEPAQRRAFLDEVLLYLKPHYLFIKAAYLRALYHRMRALVEFNQIGNGRLEVYLDELERVMSQHGAKIVGYRREVTEKLKEKLKTAEIASLFGGLVELEYLTVTKGDEDEVEAVIRRRLSENRMIDKERKRASCGPQLDELKIFLGGKTAREFASEGEQKVITILLCQAACEIIKEETGESPVFLIDDFPAGLDERNSVSMMDFLMKKGQIVMTMTPWDLERLMGLNNGSEIQVFRIEKGEVLNGAH